MRSNRKGSVKIVDDIRKASKDLLDAVERLSVWTPRLTESADRLHAALAAEPLPDLCQDCQEISALVSTHAERRREGVERRKRRQQKGLE